MLAGIGLVQPGESSHPSQSSANTSLSWTSIPPAPTPPCGRQHSILTSSSPVHLGIQSTLLCWVLPFPSGTFHTFTPLLSSPHQSLPIMPIDGQRKLTWPSPRSTEEVSPLGISYSWETAGFLPSCPGLAEAWEATTSYGCSYLFAQILTDNLLNLLPGALWGLAVQHLEGAGVLLGQEVVQRSQVLSHLDEGASVGAAQLPEALSRAQVHLWRDQNISQALLLLHAHVHIHILFCPVFKQTKDFPSWFWASSSIMSVR